MIDIKVFPVTFLETNCYLVTDTETAEAAVIDPGAKSEELIQEIRSKGLTLAYVLLTHGHFDHIGYAKQLADLFGAKIVIGEKGGEFLHKGNLNLSDFHKNDIGTLHPFTADILLNDRDVLMLGTTKITYLTTPGHTVGCGCYLMEDSLFCGDTLFCESYGRTDLFTGDEQQMARSLKKLKDLKGNLKAYPGHGPSTSLDHERKYNPLMSLL